MIQTLTSGTGSKNITIAILHKNTIDVAALVNADSALLTGLKILCL
jgi:hypothetical protein